MRPDAPSKCTFDASKPDVLSPHHHVKPSKRPVIASTILDMVGDTPLVRLNRIPKEEGVTCEILAKCEYFNPGGSVKDRIAKRMVEEGERSENYQPGHSIVEPTSGNTGIGVALVSAVKNYKCTIVMPDKMSQEKQITLKALGANVIRTPREALFEQPDSHLQRSATLCEELGPTAHIPNQYINKYNPIAHFDTTGQEILDACADGEPDGKPRIDMIVCGAGTGGTISGIGALFKLKLPSCKTVAVDPQGSMLSTASLGCLKQPRDYEVEGIGYEFVPTVLNNNVIDHWIRITDKESFHMARRLIRSEGLLVGGSSGTVVAGAIKAIKRFNLGEGHRVVVLLADSCHNYHSKFLSDGWMISNDFLPLKTGDYFSESLLNMSVGDFMDSLSEKKKLLPQIDHKCTLKESGRCTSGKLSMIVRDGAFVGVYDPKLIAPKILSGEASSTDEVGHFMEKSHKQVTKEDPMSLALRYLANFAYVIVVGEDIHDGAYAITYSDILASGN